MPKVVLKEKEEFDELFKRFKRTVNKSGVLNDCKKHDYYVKPGLKKRLKKEEARHPKRKF